MKTKCYICGTKEGVFAFTELCMVCSNEIDEKLLEKMYD